MSERSGIALNAGDSGWPVAAAAEPGPKKDGTGADLHPKALAVANGVITASEEAQVVEVANSGVAGADFTLTFSGQTTAAIDRAADGPTVQAALEALTNIAPGDIRVTGLTTGRWLVEFLPGGAYAGNAADMTIASAQAEVETLTVTGAPTGGNFKLEADLVGGGTERTAAIAWNAAAAAVDTAVEALSSVGAGGVVAAGGPLPATPVTLTFPGGKGDVAQLRVVERQLTGGTTPDAAVTTTTPGGVTPSVYVAAVGS